MVWDPKDPWGKKSDPLEEAFKQAQSQFKDIFPPGGLKKLLPSGGILNLVIAALLIFLVWQSVFIVAPDEEGVVKRFGVPVRQVEPGPHFKIPLVETVLQPKVAKLYRVEVGFRSGTDLDVFHCVTCSDVSKAQDSTEGLGPHDCRIGHPAHKISVKYK